MTPPTTKVTTTATSKDFLDEIVSERAADNPAFGEISPAASSSRPRRAPAGRSRSSRRSPSTSRPPGRTSPMRTNSSRPPRRAGSSTGTTGATGSGTRPPRGPGSSGKRPGGDGPSGGRPSRRTTCATASPLCSSTRGATCCWSRRRWAIPPASSSGRPTGTCSKMPGSHRRRRWSRQSTQHARSCTEVAQSRPIGSCGSCAARAKYRAYQGKQESGRRGSNPRPQAWEARALPAELRPRRRQSYQTP